jgi:hypothetical protein
MVGGGVPGNEQRSTINPKIGCNIVIILPSLQYAKTVMVNRFPRLLFVPVPTGLHALPDF